MNKTEDFSKIVERIQKADKILSEDSKEVKDKRSKIKEIRKLKSDISPEKNTQR